MDREKFSTGTWCKHGAYNTARVVCDPAITTGFQASVLEGSAGYYAAKGDYVSAGVGAVSGLALLALGRHYRMKREDRLVQAGFFAGLDTGINLSERERAFFGGLAESDEPLYESLDTSVSVKDPNELLSLLGDGPDVASRRIILILHHAEKRELNDREVETLRQAEAALRMMPGFDRLLCEEGQGIVASLHSTVSRYEEKYAQDHMSEVDSDT